MADIEDSITDVTMTKKKMEILDKTRGFVKYDREKKLYKDAKLRQEGNIIHIYLYVFLRKYFEKQSFLGWDEIYDFKNVRKGLKKQAARCMDCGVPFCHSTSHGCPLGENNQLFVYIFKMFFFSFKLFATSFFRQYYSKI